MGKVLVGTFSEQDLICGTDKVAIDKAKKETGLKYTQSQFIKKKGKIVGMTVWVCTADLVKF